MPRVSFVVPIYRPKHLDKCLKSLVGQSSKDWEAILVLDGPDEDARLVIDKHLKGLDYKVIEIEHGGACKARNAGGAVAKGEFLWFLDCDVVLEPEVCKAYVELFDKRPDAGFIYAGYRFFDEQGGIPSQPFDPWTLRVRNYVSTCFPLRREFYPGWDESLESLQDWDFWLSAVEKGAKGHYLAGGYAFSTAFPDPDSLSGKGCTHDVWLSRMDKVREKHGIAKKTVCVSSLEQQHEGLRLAKWIDADYQDYPNDKPNHYKTIIQIGFNLLPKRAQLHASIFRDAGVRKILFWTSEDVLKAYNAISFSAVRQYAILLNGTCYKQYVEDKTACDMLKAAGFNVEVMPLPLRHDGDIPPLPEKPKFLVDIQADYGPILGVIERAVPDIELAVDPSINTKDLTGVIQFYSDRTMSNTIKRAILTDRHVISNVQAPFAGFVDDRQDMDKFIPQMVDRIRRAAKASQKPQARQYWEPRLKPEALLEAINA